LELLFLAKNPIKIKKKIDINKHVKLIFVEDLNQGFYNSIYFISQESLASIHFISFSRKKNVYAENNRTHFILFLDIGLFSEPAINCIAFNLKIYLCKLRN
jgi:hypothetical protein